MKKNLFFAAIAITALASCSSNDYVGDQSPQDLSGTEGAISFNMNTATVTRAGGSTAADALDNHFIVYGEKSETADGAAPVTDGSTTHQLVFKNYVVKYTESTANTTTSNTKNWEYVGLTQTYGTNVVPQAGETPQTIKYWDYGASNYVFTAVSALESELTSGAVKVTKIQSKTTDNKVYDKGYTVTLAAGATATKLYFSDRQVINQGTGTDRTYPNVYGGNVTLTFRNATSQIRVGMYETIPGYSVKIKKFYYVDNAAPTFGTMSTGVTSNFTANVPNLSTSSGATLTVTYYNEGTRINQPKISASGTAANYITLTGSGLAADVTLNTTAASPTYDNSANYTTVFPQESNDKSLKLKIDYQLVSTIGETINVTGATAEIPAQYLQWKPNYKYTYLFKISDNTNGSTGGDVVGLYPITFDAVEIVAEDGTAEYITTVSEPSITTFGAIYNNSDVFQAYVADESDYKIPSGTDKLNIYATIMDNSNVADFTFNSQAAGGVNVYKVTSSDATNFPVTEASVAEALAEISSGTKKITCTPKNADGTISFSAVPAKVTTVPGEDGVGITIKALKLSGIKEAGQYAIEYVKTPATYHTTEHTYTSADAVTTAISGGLTLYTNSAGTTLASSSNWVDSSTKFYSRDAVQSVGVYTYKIVTVTSAP